MRAHRIAWASAVALIAVSMAMHGCGATARRATWPPIGTNLNGLSDPRDYIRNIRMIPEGARPTAGEIFNPIFLDRLGGYRALRFMIWMLGDSAEDIAARSWSHRTKSGTTGIRRLRMRASRGWRSDSAPIRRKRCCAFMRSGR